MFLTLMDSTDSIIAGLIVFLLLFMVVAMALGIFTTVVMCKLFSKAGEEWWKYLIPCYNIFVLSKFSTGQYLMAILIVVFSVLQGIFSISEDLAILGAMLSLGSAGVQIYTYYKFAKSFGCSDARCVCAALFGPLALIKPAFDKTGRYTYVGPNGEYSGSYASRVLSKDMYTSNYGNNGQNYGSYGNNGQNYGGYGNNGQNYNSYGNNGQNYNSYGNNGQNYNSYGNNGQNYNSYGNNGQNYNSYGNNGQNYSSYGNNGQNYSNGNQGYMPSAGQNYGGNAQNNGTMQEISLDSMPNREVNISKAIPAEEYMSSVSSASRSNQNSSQNAASFNTQNNLQDAVPSGSSYSGSGVNLNKTSGVLQQVEVIDAQPGQTPDNSQTSNTNIFS